MEPVYRQAPPRGPVTGPALRALLIANLAAFALASIAPAAAVRHYALWPIGHGFQVWQPFTAAFLHAGLAHLATNLFGLWMFGREVEMRLGARAFLRLYVASLLTAALAQLAVGLIGDPVPSLGASGAVFGVLMAYALLFPNRRVLLLIPPIPMKARTFVIGYALVELALGVNGVLPGVAHFAHLGGLLGGYLALRSAPAASS